MVFFWQRKKKAIRKFVVQLPADLTREFGKKRKYTPEEIEAVFKKYNYRKEQKYWCYGFALYSGRPEFQAYHHARNESCDFGAMRKEIQDIVLSAGVLLGGIADQFVHQGDVSHGGSGGGDGDGSD